MSEFLGAGHGEVLSALQARLAAIMEGDVSLPRVVVLEGASGVGKSRTVRELYRVLRESRHDSYWPELADDTSRVDGVVSRDPLPDRKLVGPPVEGFVWPAGVLPTFGWWTFNCERAHAGDAIDVVAQARPSLSEHLSALAIARKEAMSGVDFAKDQRENAIARAKEAMAEGGLEAASALLGKFDIVIPGLGTGLSWLTRGAQAARRSFEERQSFTNETVLGQGAQAQQRDAADELAGLIAGVAHQKVPGVVVVEDLHLMGEGLAPLLDRLSRGSSKSPVLVVAMAWPEARGKGVYGWWLSGALADGRAEVIAMPDLGQDDLVAMLREYAPNTAGDVAVAAVSRWGSPLVLKAVMTSNRARRAIDQHGGAFPPEAIESIPATILDVYRMRFGELDEQVRLILALCAGAVPDATTVELWPFLRDIIARAVDGYDGVDSTLTQVLAGVEYAADGRAWLVPSGVADSFREAIQAQIAFGYLTDEIVYPKDVPALRAAVKEELRVWINEHRDGFWLSDREDAQIVAKWFLAIDQELSTVGQVELDEATIAARCLLALQFATAHQYIQAIDEIAPVLPALDPGDPGAHGLRALYAVLLGEVGRVGEAITLLESLSEDQMRVLGADHPDAMTIQNILVFFLGQAGRTAEAISMFEVLLADQMRVLGADHPATLTSRSNLASLLGKSGRVAEAIFMFEVLLADQMRVLGADHPATLTSRSELASLLGKSGRVAEAISMFEVLLADQMRVLGADHPSTLTIRSNLAFFLGESGRAAEAITLYESLLADKMRVLGADHPDTLTTRGNLATRLGEVGRAGEAITLFESLLEDETRVLDADHPGLLKTRNNLASMLAKSGHTAEAISMFEVLLADQMRVLGADHPDTLTIRSNLAFFLDKAGRVDEAVTLFLALFEDQMRVLGADHPATLMTRFTFANWYGEAGRTAESITLFESLLEDQMRVLDADHPDILKTRNNLAVMLGRAGRTAEAITLLESLLEDQTRVLGPDDADTLATRDKLRQLKEQSDGSA